MKPIFRLIALLAPLLLCPGIASAQLRGGHNEPTDILESAFKILASERIAADDECYPDPERLAEVLRRETDEEVVVSESLDAVEGEGLVNVVNEETECNRLVLAMRSGKVFILDSDHGPVYVQGSEGLSEESLAAGIGPLRDLTLATNGFRMEHPHTMVRLEVLCPEGGSPLGGGMISTPPLAEDGEGIYPHSYERLGVQRGYHITPTFVDRSPKRTTPRTGVIQVVCGRGLVPEESPHETVFVRREGTGSVTARCPEGTQLFSGGFQRTNFTTPEITFGGNYITESRAIGTTAWRVSAGATDDDGGELTAIAHCANDRSLPITEVSASTEVGEKESATATTPPCPAGRELTAGGFSFDGSFDALFGDGHFNRDGSWSATGYGYWGSAELIAYGYCLKVTEDEEREAFPAQRAELAVVHTLFP